METVNFLVPVGDFVRSHIQASVTAYPKYLDWPMDKKISYLSDRAVTKWRDSIIDYAMAGNPLPVNVIDSWADMYGVTGYGGVLHTFRGTAERAIRGWMPKDLRD